MKRFLITKLIVMSESERASFETTFEKGLNIIIGENKTGKSSIIQSIFYTLGCETKMAGDWKKLISAYILYFKYGEKKYCIVRKEKEFTIYELSIDTVDRYKRLFRGDKFHEYSNYLVQEIFGVDINLLTKDGKSINITPPLLFCMQYIDQEEGWWKIGESFGNTKYIKNWKSYSIKFIVGYQNQRFYMLKRKIDESKRRIDELTIKNIHYNEILRSIEDVIQNKPIDGNESSTDYSRENVENTLEEIDKSNKTNLTLKRELNKISNLVYEKNLELRFLQSTIKSLEDDQQFTVQACENIKCPTCGMDYSNDIETKMSIVKDIQQGYEAIKSLRQDINDLVGEADKLHQLKEENLKLMHRLKLKLDHMKSSINYIEQLKQSGRKEILEVSYKENEKIVADILKQNKIKENDESEVKTLESRARVKEIKDKIIEKYKIILTGVKIDHKYIKLNNFIQPIKNTGSEKPRMILAYHTALYLYNLSKGENLFNWLVIDTPNQQGQDYESLKAIDSIIAFMVDDTGQVLLGTERKTGFEEKANNVIELTKKRNCLNKDNFSLHQSLIEDLSLIK